MDPIRQIRLFIPPFFFYMSLIFAQLSSDFSGTLLWLEKLKDLGGIGGIAAFIAITALPIGFLISSIAVLFMKFVFWVFGKNYETNLSEDEINYIWPLLQTRLGRYERLNGNAVNKKRTPTDIRRYVTNTFDYEMIRKHSEGIHEWIVRAYTAFSISANSFFGLLLSLIIICILGICPPYYYWVIFVFTCGLLIIGAFFARKDTFGMTRFQLKRMNEDWLIQKGQNTPNDS